MRSFASQIVASALAVVLVLFQAAVAAPAGEEAKPPLLAGNWVGPLQAGALELRLALQIAVEGDGKMNATLVSIDQGPGKIPVESITLVDGTLTAELKTIGGNFVGKLNDAGDALVGSWTQGPATLPLTLKKTEGEFALNRPQEPKPPFSYRTEEVAFDNVPDKARLAGTLTLPDGDGPYPAVILITGSGPQDRDESLMGHRPFLVLADYLTRRNIAVLRYDDRGYGKSTGDFAAATTEDFKRDAAAALAYLKTRPEIDSTRIGLCGHSEGGLIAPMVAAESPEVAFIVLMAGTGVTGEEILYRQSALLVLSMGGDQAAADQSVAMQKKIFAQLKKDPDPQQLVVTLKEIVASVKAEDQRKVLEQTLKSQAPSLIAPWFRAFLLLDPRDSLKRVTCPVLAINGEKDIQVDPKQNLPEIAAALKAGGNADVTTQEMPGLNHLFQSCETGALAEYGQIEETIAPAALETIGDWIAERTQPK